MQRADRASPSASATRTSPYRHPVARSDPSASARRRVRAPSPSGSRTTRPRRRTASRRWQSRAATPTRLRAGGTIYYNGNNAGAASRSPTRSPTGSRLRSRSTIPVLSGVLDARERDADDRAQLHVLRRSPGPRRPRRRPALSLTETDSAGNTVANTVTLANDTTAPTGGAISVPADSNTLNNIAITTTNFTDGGSGIATQRDHALQRAGPGDPRRLLPGQRLHRLDRRHEPRHRSHRRHVLRVHAHGHRQRRQRPRRSRRARSSSTRPRRVATGSAPASPRSRSQPRFRTSRCAC